jgi:hypothetical protein
MFYSKLTLRQFVNIISLSFPLSFPGKTLVYTVIQSRVLLTPVYFFIYVVHIPLC